MTDGTAERGEMLLTANEVAEMLGVGTRMVLLAPIRRIQLGPKTIRFRLKDVYAYAGIDDPDADG